MAFATLYIHFQTCLLEMEELKNIIKNISLKIVDDPIDGLVIKENDYEYYIRKFFNFATVSTAFIESILNFSLLIGTEILNYDQKTMRAKIDELVFQNLTIEDIEEINKRYSVGSGSLLSELDKLSMLTDDEEKIAAFKASLVIRNSDIKYHSLLKNYSKFKEINKIRNELIHFKTKKISHTGLEHYLINDRENITELWVCDYYGSIAIEECYQKVKQFGIELLKKSGIVEFLEIDIIKLLEIEKNKSIIFEGYDFE